MNSRDQWGLENPSDEEHAENVAAINASLDDYKQGERGRPAKDVSKDIATKLGLGDGVL